MSKLNTVESFTFPHLGEETGNFPPIIDCTEETDRKLSGNSMTITQARHGLGDVQEESSEKLDGNYYPGPGETSKQNIGSKVATIFGNLPAARSTQQLIDQFIAVAPSSGVPLLYDDHAWIKTILYGVPVKQATALLERYIAEWKIGGEGQPTEHRKDNSGRFRANTFLRESLTRRSAKL